MTAGDQRTAGRWFAIYLVILLVLASGVSAASARGDALVGVKVSMLPVEPTMQAAYAKSRGLFERQGLDVEITPLSDPTQAIAAVLSGDVQFTAFNIGGLAAAKARGFPVRLVAAGALYRPKAPTAALVAAPGQRIGGARDLVGKRIAIDLRNTIAHIALLKWLKRNGVSSEDVTLVELPFAQMIAPLARRQVDAAVLPEPFLTMVTQRGASRIAPIFDSVCPADCPITVWVARRDVDPNLAARFRNAIQAASVWANEKKNHPASAAILAKYAPIDAAVLRKMARTSFATRLRPAAVQPWIDSYAEFGVIPASFSAIDLVR